MKPAIAERVELLARHERETENVPVACMAGHTAVAPRGTACHCGGALLDGFLLYRVEALLERHTGRRLRQGVRS